MLNRLRTRFRRDRTRDDDDDDRAFDSGCDDNGCIVTRHVQSAQVQREFTSQRQSLSAMKKTPHLLREHAGTRQALVDFMDHMEQERSFLTLLGTKAAVMRGDSKVCKEPSTLPLVLDLVEPSADAACIIDKDTDRILYHDECTEEENTENAREQRWIPAKFECRKKEHSQWDTRIVSEINGLPRDKYPEMYEHLATVFSELLPSMLPLMCGEIDAMRFALLHKSLPTHFECEVVVKVRRMVFYGREERYSSTMHVEGTPDETISAVGLYFPRIDERLLGGILDLEKRRGVHYLVQGGDARIETDMGVAFANWAGPHRLSGVRPVANFSDRCTRDVVAFFVRRVFLGDAVPLLSEVSHLPVNERHHALRELDSYLVPGLPELVCEFLVGTRQFRCAEMAALRNGRHVVDPDDRDRFDYSMCEGSSDGTYHTNEFDCVTVPDARRGYDLYNSDLGSVLSDGVLSDGNDFPLDPDFAGHVPLAWATSTNESAVG